MAGLTIGKFADAEGVGVETVRFYQRRGLLAQPARGRSGFREYTEDDRWRLAFIRRAQGLGFTLAEISDLLGPAEARSTDEIVRTAEAKLAAVADQLGELARLQCRLRRLVQVELPLAIPIVIAGLRIAVVSSISLASVGGLIGVNSLGYFFIDGLQRDFNEEIYLAIAAVIVLALACDFLLVLARRRLTPWSRSRGNGGGRAMVNAEGAPLLQEQAI